MENLGSFFQWNQQKNCSKRMDRFGGQRSIWSVSFFMIASMTSCLDERSGDKSESGGLILDHNQFRGGCDSHGCGKNSPVMDGIIFHELNLNGEFNRSGLKIVEVQDENRNVVEIDVDGDELLVLPSRSFTEIYIIVKFVPMMVTDKKPIYEGKKELIFAIRVRKPSLSSFLPPFEDIPKFGSIRNYRVEYSPLQSEYDSPTSDNHEYRYLCSSQITGSHGEPMATDDAIIFSGDRYDPVDRSVSTVDHELPEFPIAGWFNIACAGSSVAKMHRARMTQASSGTNTTWKARQAMLRNLTGTYCEGERSWTIPNEPLNFGSGKIVYHNPDSLGRREAVWGSEGVICLSEPRRLAEEGLDLLIELQAKCPGIRACEKTDFEAARTRPWGTSQSVLSWVP